MSQCCLSGFKWDGKPVGKETMLAKNKAYVTGANQDVAIVLIHNIFDWTWPNLRPLADHYAKEADATVLCPICKILTQGADPTKWRKLIAGANSFDGEVITSGSMAKSGAFDLKAFIGGHSKELRFPDISSCAKALKQDHGFKKLGAIGFCYGNNLVDCISTAQPALLTKEEINAVAVPVQIIPAEHDTYLTPEVKAHANSIVPGLNVDYDYQYFPGMTHGFATRSDQSYIKQKKALERAKNAAVAWFVQMLHVHEIYLTTSSITLYVTYAIEYPGSDPSNHRLTVGIYQANITASNDSRIEMRTIFQVPYPLTQRAAKGR